MAAPRYFSHPLLQLVATACQAYWPPGQRGSEVPVDSARLPGIKHAPITSVAGRWGGHSLLPAPHMLTPCYLNFNHTWWVISPHWLVCTLVIILNKLEDEQMKESLSGAHRKPVPKLTWWQTKEHPNVPESVPGHHQGHPLGIFQNDSHGFQYVPQNFCFHKNGENDSSAHPRRGKVTIHVNKCIKQNSKFKWKKRQIVFIL